MSLDLAATAEAIVTALKAGVDTTRVTVRAFPEEGMETDAVIGVRCTGVAYRRSFSASGIAELTWALDVDVACPAGVGDSWRLLYDLMGTGNANSIFDAIAADPTLGGVVQAAVAQDVTIAEGAPSGTFTLSTQERRGTA